MHKFFIGSKKTIAAMMAVLMFTSSTGGYAQAGMIEDAFPQNAQTEASAETVSDPRQPVVVTTPEAEPAVTEPEVSQEVTQEPEENKDASKETTVDSQPSADDTNKSGQDDQNRSDGSGQKKEEASDKPASSDAEKSDTERSDKSDAGKESEDLSNTVTRFIQDKDSYAYMEKITNMDELLKEMDEEQLYELLYFMRLSFLGEVPENHSQTLDTYYEILEAYLKAKTEEPKQEWQDLVLPYLPSYEEGMESTEDYLEAVDGKDFDLLSLEDQMASLESCTDWEKLPAQEKTVTIEAAMQSVRQDIKDGKANDAVWTMYHYGYFSEVLMELDAESLDAFFQGLDDENRFVFNKLTGYAYFQFVDQGYALDGYSDQAEILRYFYQDAEETDKADEILLAYINKQNDTAFASVADYEADLTKDSSEDFGEVMEAWNLYLEGRLDSLVKKAEKEEIRETPIEKKNPQEPAVPDDPEMPENSENTGDDDQATMPGGAVIGEKDTLADIAYPAPDKDLKSGISTYTVPTSSGYWVTAGKSWTFVSNGQTVKGDWIYDGVHWYYARSSDGYLIVSSHAVVDNRAYYFNASGEMLANQTNIQLGNYKYNINGSGYIQSGWISDSWITGRWFYVENYATIYGWKQIGNSVADAGGDTNPYYFFGSSTNRAMYWNGYQEISGVDYYFDGGGHWIAAQIGSNNYYRLVTPNTGAIDKAWSGCTIKILGGNHENSSMHIITNKNLTITSDGAHRVYIKNNENIHSTEARNSVFYVSGGSLTVNGYISFDGGQYDDYSKNTENNGSDVLTSGSGGNITVDSANVKIYRCTAGVHASYTSNKAGTITVNKAEIYHCLFGIGTYGNVNVDGANIHDNVQNIHMNCFYQNNTMNVKNAKIHDATLGAVGFVPAWANLVQRTATMNISDTEVYNNRSGLILSENLADNSSLNVNSGVNVHNNTYGVLAHSYGTVNIGKNAAVTPKIVNNTSHGILCDSKTPSGVSIVIDKATITGNGNTSENGGGVLTTASVSTSSNTNISSNKGAQGGGIYGESTCTITVNGGTFNSNSANGCGGAICSQGTLNLNSGTLKNNTATSDGGAIWFKHGTIKGTIENNSAGNLGGGVSHSGDSTAAYISGGTINSNKAKSGGGLYTDGTLEITGGEIKNNTATNAGGIQNLGIVTMTGGTVSGNSVSWDGGGVACYHNSTFNFNGGTIQDNTAYWLGGNIFLYAMSDKKTTFTVNNTTPISGGTAQNSGGGGVSVYGSGATLVLNDGAVLKDNTAPYGGGIDSSGTIELKNATISGNTAVAANGNGGGIHLFADANGVGSLKMTSGTIKDNTATAEGGGIWGKNVTISGGTISGNTAGTVGGGVLLNGTGACTMSGGTIKENTSTYSGGGVFVDDNTPFTMTGGTISDNKAGGNGGGIYTDNAANVTISDGSVTGNKADWGGGVYVNGIFTMKGGTLSGNTCKTAGGAVAIFDDTNGAGKMILSGGTIENNTVTNETGGGICNLGTLEMSGGTIRNNTAPYNGGGIYVSAVGKDTTITGGSITGNHAQYSGGIYIENNAAATITGGSISENTTDTGTAKAIYQNGTLKLGKDVQVSGDIFLNTKKIINVISDLTKANLEVSMADDDTYKQRVIAEYSADTTSYKNGTKDTTRYSLETNTNGYAKKKGIKISDTGTKGQSYQVWLDGNMLPIRVNYIGRYATQGSVQSEIVQPDVAEYTVRKNAGYTGYQRKDYSFQGWAVIPSYRTPVYSEKTTNNITYDELLDIYETQQEAGVTGDMFKTQASEDTKKSVAGIALAAARNALSGLVLPVQVQAAEEEQVLDVYMLDTWDKYPVINWRENTFYEGTDVTKTDLLANIRLSDEEDGVIDTSKLVINSITYSAGKLENGQKSASYTVNYPDGMKDTDKLDTWFMQLDKNDSPVTHTLHCSVTDSVGNVTKADITVKVKYNEFPTITAQDRYFTLEEAQNGAITKDALLQDAVRDNKLSANDTEDGNMNDKLELVDFKADDFTSFTDSGYVTVTFHVQDSMGPDGKGKETYRQIKVYVVKDGVIEEPEKAQNVRFINQKYYDLNKDVDPDTLSEEEKEERNSNGGLNVESKWYHDADYRALIEETFGKTEGTVYEFSKEDIDRIKAYVDANGLGFAESEGAQDAFYSQFIAPAQK